MRFFSRQCACAYALIFALGILSSLHVWAQNVQDTEEFSSTQGVSDLGIVEDPQAEGDSDALPQVFQDANTLQDTGILQEQNSPQTDGAEKPLSSELDTPLVEPTAPEVIERVVSPDEQNIVDSIRVSNDYDLLLWVNGLGINKGNGRDALQRALLDYYNLPSNALVQVEKKIEATQAPTNEQNTGQVQTNTPSFLSVDVVEDEIASGTADELIIKTANRAQYFTYDKVDEDIFILQGHVEIMVNQLSEKRQHLIIADKLIYNETQRTGTAIGDVSYKVFEFKDVPLDDPSAGKSIEEFDSQIISFNIDDFNADILYGNTRTEKDVKYGKDKKFSDKLLFRIYSPHLSRSQENVIVVSNATFTSSKAIPPIYSIKLKNMWLLKPDEWAISSASVYVGEIPVMWIPFFVNPGDKFFFSPSIGFKTRTGGYFNTTTYLIGERTPEKGEEDEFLNIFNFSKQTSKKKIIKGLYLQEPEAGDKIYKFPSGWFLRYMLDYYTGLGSYTAVEGKFPQLWGFKTMDINMGIAFTQTVYNIDNKYFNYYVDDDGNFQRNYDKGYFFSTEVPFRYKFEYKIGTSLGKYYTTNLALELHSDSYLDRDFSQRSFNFSWNEIIDPNSKLVELNNRSAQKSGYYWQWNNNITIPSSLVLGNYMKSINISNLKFQINWSRKQVASEDEIDAYSKGPGVVEEKIESHFFYPSQAEIPSYQIRISGNFLTLDTNNLGSFSLANGIKKLPSKNDEENQVNNNTVEAPKEEENMIASDYDILFPSDGQKKEEEEEVATLDLEERLIYPEYQDIKVNVKKFNWTSATLKLDYNISQSLNQIIYYNATKYETVKDVDLFNEDFISYAYLTNNGTGSISAPLSLLDGWLTYKYALKLDVKYRILNYDVNLTETEREAKRKSGDNYTEENFSNSHNITVYPLKWLPILETSSIGYIADYDLGKNVFGTIEEAQWFVEEDEKWWNQHKFNQTYIAKYLGTTQTGKLNIVMPPLNFEYNPSYGFASRFLDFSASTRLVEDRLTKVFSYDPLRANAGIKFFENKLAFKEAVVYEYEFDYVDSLSSTFNMWWYTSVINSKYGPAYNFDRVTFSFVTPDQYDKKLRLNDWRNSLNYTTNSWYFWKDRISLSLNSSLSYLFHFIRFTNTSFTWSYSAKFSIYQYLNLTFSTSITNDVVYMYYDEYATQIGVDKRDVWTDVVNGFSLFDEDKLRESAFKVGTINIGAQQDFGGWIFNFGYIGGPEREVTNGVANYEWRNTLEFSVLWKPLPEFKSQAFFRDEAWSLEEEIK